MTSYNLIIHIYSREKKDYSNILAFPFDFNSNQTTDRFTDIYIYIDVSEIYTNYKKYFSTIVFITAFI